MSQCNQLKIIIYVKIFFILFNLIKSQNLIFGKPYLEDNEAFHETIDESDFLSNIHTMMTPRELYQTFGTNDGSVPDYKVFPMNLRSSRKKRQTDDTIQLRVEINDRIIDLNLVATDGHLATKNTPVWLAHTDPKAYRNIRYDPQPEIIRYIDGFRMYHDLKNEAAIAVYTDSEHNSTMEGIVTLKYAIKSLPKRLSFEVIKKSSKYFVETSISPRISIEQDETIEDEITGHFVLFKIQQDPEHSSLGPPTMIIEERKNINNESLKPKFKSRQKRQNPTQGRRNIPETVYPEILIVLEYDAIRRQSITEALQFVLAFWNGVDMFYSAINEPKIRLHIAGVIISADDNATPYIAGDTSLNVIAQSSRIIQKMGLYFYEEENRFPINFFDIVIAMTTMKLCDNRLKPCVVTSGYAALGGACQSRYKIEMLGTTRSVGIFNYNKMYGGVHAALEQSAYLFGVPHDQSAMLSSKLDEHTMAKTAEVSRNNFTWSEYSKASLRSFFSLKISQCVDNEPVLMNLTDRVLPGQWLTLDGQCRNNGFYEACKLPDLSPCISQACKAQGSDDCVETNILPLEGSKCGEKMHCEDVNYIPICK